MSAKATSTRKLARLMALYFLFSLICFQTAYAQAKRVTGTVTDSENGQPLVGATVVIKGKTTSTIPMPREVL